MFLLMTPTGEDLTIPRSFEIINIIPDIQLASRILMHYWKLIHL